MYQLYMIDCSKCVLFDFRFMQLFTVCTRQREGVSHKLVTQTASQQRPWKSFSVQRRLHNVTLLCSFFPSCNPSFLLFYFLLHFVFLLSFLPSYLPSIMFYFSRPFIHSVLPSFLHSFIHSCIQNLNKIYLTLLQTNCTYYKP